MTLNIKGHFIARAPENARKELNAAQLWFCGNLCDQAKTDTGCEPDRWNLLPVNHKINNKKNGKQTSSLLKFATFPFVSPKPNICATFRLAVSATFIDNKSYCWKLLGKLFCKISPAPPPDKHKFLGLLFFSWKLMPFKWRRQKMKGWQIKEGIPFGKQKE